jgi:hypothetical protein
MTPGASDSMTPEQTPAQPPTDVLVACAQQWLDIWRHAGAVGMGGLTAASLFDVKRLQRLWLAELTRTMDAYLRTPAFLEVMRTGLRAVTGRPASPVPPPR